MRLYPLSVSPDCSKLVFQLCSLRLLCHFGLRGLAGKTENRRKINKSVHMQTRRALMHTRHLRTCGLLDSTVYKQARSCQLGGAPALHQATTWQARMVTTQICMGTGSYPSRTELRAQSLAALLNLRQQIFEYSKEYVMFCRWRALDTYVSSNEELVLYRPLKEPSGYGLTDQVG